MRKGLLLSRKGARCIGSGLIHGIIYHFEYEICLDDIFNCFREIFAIFFTSLLILFLLVYAKRTFAFSRRSLGLR